jgi:hypothetical protein
MQPSFADGDEDVARPGHVEIRQDLGAEHLPVKFQSRLEV